MKTFRGELGSVQRRLFGQQLAQSTDLPGPVDADCAHHLIAAQVDEEPVVCARQGRKHGIAAGRSAQHLQVHAVLVRAALNPLSSSLSGVDVNRVLMIGWGVAGAIGAVAGLLAAPVVFLSPNMMSGIMIYGFAAAVVGGVDSPPGAILGGLLLGIGENLLGAYVTGNELKLTIALAVMFAILVVRPQGLLSGKAIQRV